jgi:hypothetical protein
MRLIALTSAAVAAVCALALGNVVHTPAKNNTVTAFCAALHNHEHRFTKRMSAFDPAQPPGVTRALFGDLAAAVGALARSAPHPVARDMRVLAREARIQRRVLAAVDYRFRAAPRSTFDSKRGEAAAERVERFQTAHCRPHHHHVDTGAPTA